MRFAAKWVKVKAAGHTFSRLVVAHFNRDGRDFQGNPVQSFAPRFRIAESGDYTEEQADIPRSMLADLAHRGIKASALTWG